MISRGIPIWKEAPFLRLVLPLMLGITAGYYLRSPAITALTMMVAAISAMLAIGLLPVALRFRWSWVQGSLLNISLVGLGGLVVAVADHRAEAEKGLAFSQRAAMVVVTITEQPVERRASWKAEAKIMVIQNSTRGLSPPVGVFLYFRKHALLQLPQYGDTVYFRGPLQPITNTGIAGGFDYQRYCALKNIHFRAFLRTGNTGEPVGWRCKTARSRNSLYAALIASRGWVTSVLKHYIPGQKESGLAEALLIGYREDVDQSLMQSYASTGVIHVVAISGLHLGLIYAILKRLCRPFGHRQKRKWITVIIVLAGLWAFSLLAGASPSVLRSAVMFSFVVLGELAARKAPVVNSLAASAFLLLCFNPLWLWDLGFQLSYAALLSIVIFQKPLYELFSFRMGIADTVWKLNAVTISAQALTTPMSVYYFNQFPNLFLVSNLVAVPLSSLVLLGEILLCAISFAPPLAAGTGWVLSLLISTMNHLVEWLSALPFSTSQGLSLSFPQLALMYLAIFFLSSWTLLQRRSGLPLTLACTIVFLCLARFKIWP